MQCALSGKIRFSVITAPAVCTLYYLHWHGVIRVSRQGLCRWAESCISEHMLGGIIEDVWWRSWPGRHLGLNSWNLESRTRYELCSVFMYNIAERIKTVLCASPEWCNRDGQEHRVGGGALQDG